jgi:hypothetical protein
MRVGATLAAGLATASVRPTARVIRAFSNDVVPPTGCHDSVHTTYGASFPDIPGLPGSHGAIQSAGFRQRRDTVVFANAIPIARDTFTGFYRGAALDSTTRARRT